MCRWVAWIGEPIYLENVISKPDHSLIEQSREAHSCKTAINADGVGVAWYDTHEVPGLYKNVHPAWSDPNLQQIARQIRSRLFFAHVRASTGSATSYNNCHPFAVDNWAFMHNGMVGGFDRLRKKIEHDIDDDLYQDRKGATDSEALFLTALGHGLDKDPIGAMAATILQITAYSKASGVTPHMRFTGCWTDGDVIYAARYASDKFAPTLFYNQTPSGTLIVSEPLDAERSDWIEVPQNAILVASRDTLSVHDFITPETPLPLNNLAM